MLGAFSLVVKPVLSSKPYRVILPLACLVTLGALSPAQQPGGSAKAPTAKNQQAPIENLNSVYGPFDLKADTLQQMPQRRAVSFPEDIWLVGYRAEIVDSGGNKLPRELQCHTFLGSSIPEHQRRTEVVGIFSDGYTDSMDLPEGFGLLFKAGEDILWMPMFNNRTPQLSKAAMRVTFRIIRDRNLQRPLKALTTTFRSVQFPDLYYVQPGRDVRENTFHLRAGKIHTIGTHIHPYGVSIELVNLTRDESVWKAVGRTDDEGALAAMPVYKNREGYTVRPDDRFKLIAIYENTSTEPVDAMAAIFVLYSPEL